MRCFLKGFLGALLMLALAAVIIPQYSDYVARAETGVLLVLLEPVQRAIEADAAKQKSFAGMAKHLALPAKIADKLTVFEVSDAGEIIAKGGRNGQMIILSPSLLDGKITWRCLGAPDHDVPARCRSARP
ncbi:pilin [Massilia scottii]|uniref:pilin n=1 Tax=Massilia scottii TaxID=3057166 RepID=UPI0027964704|nr:pilin [Massilia sp. CCM 9029]MDQ1831370.1 pilin [Massilia sp. CCM 9029]